MRKRPDEVLRQSPKSKVKVLKTTQVHKTLTFMQSKSFLQNVSVSSIAGYFSIQRERKWIIAKYLTHHEILELALFFPSPRVTFTKHQVFTELYFLSNIYLQHCWWRHPNVARIHNMKMNVTPDFQRYFQNHDEQQREVKQDCQQLWRHSRIAMAVCFSTPPHCLYGRPSVNDKNRM